jgi:hypothetical protein
MVIYHNNNITIYNINGNFRILKWRYWTVPYFWPYFVIFPEISASKIGLIYGRYLQFRFLKWPLKYGDYVSHILHVWYIYQHLPHK